MTDIEIANLADAKRREYFRVYFSDRYSNDPVYREAKKTANRGRYVRKTTACVCGGSITASAAAVDPSVCRKCRLSAQPARPRGRPRLVRE